MKPAIKKRWAIMMIGGARTYAFTRESFHRHVVHQTEPPMDLFVSTAFSNNNLFGGLSSRLLEMDSTKLVMTKSTPYRGRMKLQELKIDSSENKGVFYK